MATATLDQEVITLEKQYWDVMAKRDKTGLRALTGDQFIMTMSEGITLCSRDEFIDMMMSDGFRMKSYKIDDGTVTVATPADDIAIVAYRAQMDYEREGKPGKSDSYFSSTWIRDGRAWRCVAGCESKVA